MDVDEPQGIDFSELADVDAGDVNSSAYHPETARVLAELDRRKIAGKLAVPTSDATVRQRLRELRQPITLFGERKEDRRERLRTLLTQIKIERGDGDYADGIDTESGSDDEQTEEFYTPGTDALMSSRRNIAAYSLARAKKRVARQRLESTIPLGRLMDYRKSIFAELKTYTTLGSQIGDDRPLGQVKFSPDSSLLATGSWSGTAKIFDVPSCTCRAVFKGHGVERIGGVAWHPGATLTQPANVVNLVTGGADGKLCLWPISEMSEPRSRETPQASLKPLRELNGHTNRICRIGFHPSGRYVGSASFDQTWRLWDVETGDELLQQEGHSKGVYAIAFHDDGSLACSGGMDALGRVWDLRSGKTAMTLDGHSDDILGIDFAPNGYQVATASNDSTIHLWDMRQIKKVYVIAAHSATVSDVTFYKPSSLDMAYPRTVKGAITDGTVNADVSTDKPDDEVPPPLGGLYLASSGYDGLVKFWSADDWQLQHAVAIGASGGESKEKVMSVDLSRDGRFLAAGNMSRTFHLIAAEGVSL